MQPLTPDQSVWESFQVKIDEDDLDSESTTTVQATGANHET